MSTIYILWLREMKRYSRSRAQIVASLGQPLLYLLALGFGLGPVFAQSGHGSYLQFLAPGVIGMTLLLVLVVCVIAGFRPVNLLTAPSALMTMMLIAILFCALGTVIGSLMQSMQAFPLIMNFLMLPLFFLSGALYPLDGLPVALRAITTINPLTIGMTHFGLPLDLTVLAVTSVLFLALGAFSFSRIQP
jgi:ABC-2 type transport system permease protein